MIKAYLSESFAWHRYQLLLYLLGVVLFAFGARVFLDTGLGADPLDVLVVGMDKHLGVGLGLCSSLVAAFFLLWWAAWNRQPPPLTPFVTTSAVGFLLDIFAALDMRRYTVGALMPLEVNFGSLQFDLGHLFAVICALVLCAYASALIIMSGVGIRIMDLVAITIVERMGWSFFKAKMTLEIGLFSFGWMLGGPIGITTVLFLIFVGPFIQPFMWANERYIGIPNHGLRKSQSRMVRSSEATQAG